MSEQYIVSARKYRPQKFDTVIGQEHITTTLKNAITNQQLAHAYLFCGPRGVGKTTCARILARTINCESPTADMEACGQCTTCVSFNDNASFNIFELDAASNNSVDDIRALTEQVRYAPQMGKYKIYIIDEVHMLSSQAFNAFLKTLEEPPSYAIFILATTEKHKILPTILSRCQIFDFKRIQTSHITDHLASICTKENKQFESTALHIIAQKSEGCMRDALSIMDRISGFTNGNLSYELTVEHLNILDADVYFQLSNLLLTKDIAGLMVQIDTILQKGFEGDVVLNGFTEHFRNLLLCKDKRMAQLLDLPEAHKKMYFENAQIISSSYILSALSVLNDAELNYRQVLNKRLHLELSLIKLGYINDVITEEELSNTEEKKKITTHEAPQSLVKKSSSYKDEFNKGKVKLQHGIESKIEEKNEYEDIKSDNEVKQDALVYKHSPAKTSNRRPKLGVGYLKELQNNNISTGDQVFPEPNQVNLEKILEEYIIHLKDVEEQPVKAEQLSMMKVQLLGADEIHLLCFSTVNLVFAQTIRIPFLEYCKKKFNRNDLRILAKLNLELTPESTVEDKPMNKFEIFEGMVFKNPELKNLKEQLNLYIE